MSAYQIIPIWQVCRAISALSHGLDIDMDAYAVEFELDMDETLDVFKTAAIALDMELEKKTARILH